MPFIVLVIVGLIGAAVWRHWFRAVAPAPYSLSSEPTWDVIGTPHGDRRFLSFVPVACGRGAPIVIVLHGSHGSAQQIRTQTGYEFEHLANRDGFIVVYPEGYEQYWNDCRVKGAWASRKQNVNDVAFLVSLVERLRSRHEAGPAFFAGYSNGGHMCFRMAFEAPEVAQGIAVVGASLPTPENLACAMPAEPLSVLLINGTSDPVNPYGGGHVSIFGFGDRGTVYSAPESAALFAAALGSDVRKAEPEEVFPATSERITRVERVVWAASAGEVELVTVHGGGHVVPQPRYRFPRFLGRTEMRFDAPAECWAFFQREIDRRR